MSNLYNCGCSEVSVPCNTSGCPIQLDYECVIYNKANNSITALSNLSLNNGATLKLFAEAVDLKLGQLNFPIFSLPCLRTSYNINTLGQFAEAVDTTLCSLQDGLDEALEAATIPISVADTTSISLAATGTLFHTLQATLNVSGAANNLLSVIGDGVYSAPQTLSVNYASKELTISSGNTVSLASLTCGVGGFLGNLATDPSSVIDGQSWYNTTSDAYKIKLNGTVKILTTT